VSMGVVVGGGGGSRRHDGGSWRSAKSACISSSSKAPVNDSRSNAVLPLNYTGAHIES